MTDRDCADGYMCDRNAGERGSCKACDDTEIPYDGVDNDCLASTLDFDLDRDGDNAKTAAVNPGGDCDDADMARSSLQLETCGDGKDNDCDTVVDEADCAERVDPTISFTAPAPGTSVAGTIQVTVDAADDFMVSSVTLSRGDTALGERTALPFAFSVDTTTFPDGLVVLVAVVTDAFDKTASAELMLNIDNTTGPMIVVDSPAASSSYEGDITVSITASDPSEVATLTLHDGDSAASPVIATVSASALVATVDSDPKPAGDQSFYVQATDGNGNVSGQLVLYSIDRDDPTLIIVPPHTAEITGLQMFTLTAADAGSGIAAIDFNGMSRSGNGLPMVEETFVVDTTALPNGPYVLTATAVDTTIIDGVAGGHAISLEARYNVYNEANVPPSIEFVDLSDGDGVYKTMTIRADAESGQGVQSVEFLIDGSVIFTDLEAPYETDYDFGAHTGAVGVALRATDTASNVATVMLTVNAVAAPEFRLADIAPLGAGEGGAHAFADFDLDGQVDIVVGTPNLIFRSGTSSLAFPTEIEIGASVDLIAVGDMDSDVGGYPDLVVVRGDELLVYINQSGMGFALGQTVSVAQFSNLRALKVANLTDTIGSPDARGDVVVAHGGEGIADFVVFEQTEAGQLLEGMTYGLSGLVVDLEVADMDNDGLNDVLVTRSNPFVTTYLHRALVSPSTDLYGAGVDSGDRDVGLSAGLITVGHLDGDAFPDVILSPLTTLPTIDLIEQDIRAPYAFEVLLGTSGDGVVQFYDRYGTVASPTEIVLMDTNADNMMDAIVSIGAGSRIQIYEGTGVAFTPHTDKFYAMAPGVSTSTMTDVNDDGLADLVAFSDSGVVYALQRANPTDGYRFDAAPILGLANLQPPEPCQYGPGAFEQQPTAVRAADLLLAGGTPGVDQVSDLVVALAALTCGSNPRDPDEEIDPVEFRPSVLVQANDGFGTFTTSSRTELFEGMVPTNLEVGDLDGDPLTGLDIVVATARQPDYGEGEGPASPNGADPYDEDVSAAYLTETPVIDSLGGVVTSSYAIQALWPPQAVDAAIADLDGDGFNEVIFASQWLNTETSEISNGHWLFSGGSLGNAPTATQRVVWDSGLGANSVVVGNFDDNANLEVVVANSQTFNVSVRSYNGLNPDPGVGSPPAFYNVNGSISALHQTELPPFDGLPDLVGVGSSGVVTVAQDGVGFSTPQFFDAGTPTEPYRISSGDFNVDGLTDIAILNPGSNDLVLLIGRPQGGYFAPDRYPTLSGPTAFDTADLWTDDTPSGAAVLTDIVLVNSSLPGIMFLINETVEE